MSAGKEAKKKAFLWTHATHNGAAQVHGGGGSAYDNVFTKNTRKYADHKAILLRFGCGVAAAMAKPLGCIA